MTVFKINYTLTACTFTESLTPSQMFLKHFEHSCQTPNKTFLKPIVFVGSY